MCAQPLKVALELDRSDVLESDTVLQRLLPVFAQSSLEEFRAALSDIRIEREFLLSLANDSDESFAHAEPAALSVKDQRNNVVISLTFAAWLAAQPSLTRLLEFLFDVRGWRWKG